MAQRGKSVVGVLPDLDWMTEASCRGHDVHFWFPSGSGYNREDRQTIDYAKTICSNCPVQQRCLHHALEFEGDGIWGGTTANERERIRRVSKIQLKNISTRIK